LSIVWWGLIVLVFTLFVLYIIGFFMPVRHSLSVSRHYALPRAELWRILTDFSEYTRWRTDLSKIQRLDDHAGADVWLETDRHAQAIAYLTSELVQQQRLKRDIVTDNLPFGGSWTFLLTDNQALTTLTITENGEVYNALFRVMGKYIIGFDRSINRFLDDLEREVKRVQSLSI